MPDGLGGERVDVGLARMFGISRSRAAELLARQLVTVDGAGRRRSPTGCCPGRSSRSPSRSEPTRSRSSRRWSRASGSSTTTSDIVVVDKPVGVAVHPSMGWTGPTVVGHLRGAGYRISTSGAPERRGDRAAARRRHLGRDGDREERARLLAAEERLPAPRGRQDLPRAGAGPPRPAARAPSTPRSAGTRSPTGSSPSTRTASTASPTTRRSRPTASPACWRCTSRPDAPTRSGCTWRR